MARQFTWTAPDGSSIVLTDRTAGYSVKSQGTRGLSSPTYRIARSTYAGLPGSALDALEADEREITLGLQVEAETAAEWRARWRALVHALRPKAGDGVLSVADEAGDVRSLTCRYAGGLEGDGEAEFPGNVGRAVVTLLAFDPWFYGDTRTIVVGLGAGTSFFPIFPLVLSPSTVQGEFEINLSDSDAPTYPLWTITGPGSNLVLTNETTDYATGQAVEVTKTIEVTASLSAGQKLIIDTRPGYQSVRRDDGTNLMDAVTSDPALWPLVEGVNKVTAALTGATSASRIEGVFRPRYSGI